MLNADEPPDILLLDIRMPEVSGMDVAKILRDRDWRKILSGDLGSYQSADLAQTVSFFDENA